MTDFTLREYQKDAVRNIINVWTEGHNKVLCIAPTGSGKTEIFCAVVREHLNANPEGVALILSHLDILTNQTKLRIRERIKITPGISQARNYAHSSDNVVISTMQSSRQYWRSYPWKYRVTCIIVDEAHYLMTESYDKIISYFPNAVVLGLTATPFKMGKLMTHYFDKIAYSISLQELIDMGYLVPPKLHEVIYKDGSLEERMNIVVEQYLQNHRGDKAIVYMDSIENAQIMRNVLVEKGINADAITSKVVGGVRDRILSNFKEPEMNALSTIKTTDVLTTVNVLSMGFDAPNVKAIFMPFKTNSPTIYMQRIGRGLRICPEIKKEHCDVYVLGNEPTIKKGFYRKLSDLILTRGKRVNKTIEDEVSCDYLPKEDVHYQWNMKVLRIINTMRKYKYTNVAEMINEKRFPPKFLKDLTLFRSEIKAFSAMPHGDKCATDKQIALLQAKGVDGQTLKVLNKKEASVLISVILGGKKDDRFVLKAGKYKDRHIMHTPWPYRQWLMRKTPGSDAAKKLMLWNEEKGRT